MKGGAGGGYLLSGNWPDGCVGGCTRCLPRGGFLGLRESLHLVPCTLVTGTRVTSSNTVM